MILGIDTSTLVSSVALVDKNKVLAELNIQSKLTHSEMLMPHIDQLLKLAQVDKKAVTGIAVSIGPGSFTGLRIGLATAKTIAYALDIPIIGVPTMEALAYNCPIPEVYIMPLLDAQKGNCYTAKYCWEEGKLIIKEQTKVDSFDNLLSYATNQDKKVIILGEIAIKHADKIKELHENIILAQPQIIFAKASSVAFLGIDMQNRGINHDVMTLEPYYIRKSEAEVLWEQRNGISHD